MITRIKGRKCQYEGCSESATAIAVGREHKKVAVYCDRHKTIVLEEKNPEYEVSCPNCGCMFGEN